MLDPIWYFNSESESSEFLLYCFSMRYKIFIYITNNLDKIVKFQVFQPITNIYVLV